MHRSETSCIGVQGDSSLEEAQRVTQGELALTERALRKNPKSYAAWFHRRWVVQHGHCSLEKELDLVDKYACSDKCIAF